MHQITFGTFDCLHVGHIAMLAKIPGPVDIGLSTDLFAVEKKKRRPLFTFTERSKMLKTLPRIGEIIPCASFEDEQNLAAVKQYRTIYSSEDWPDLFRDFHATKNVVYLPRYQGISTTEIIRRARL